MPKGTLTFDLPEETPEFDCAFRGRDWVLAVLEYDEWLRNQTKHYDHTPRTDGIQECRDMLNYILDNANLNMGVLP